LSIVNDILYFFFYLIYLQIIMFNFYQIWTTLFYKQ